MQTNSFWVAIEEGRPGKVSISFPTEKQSEQIDRQVAK